MELCQESESLVTCSTFDIVPDRRDRIVAPLLLPIYSPEFSRPIVDIGLLPSFDLDHRLVRVIRNGLNRVVVDFNRGAIPKFDAIVPVFFLHEPENLTVKAKPFFNVGAVKDHSSVPVYLVIFWDGVSCHSAGKDVDR